MIKISLANKEEDFKQIEALGQVIWLEHYMPIIGIDQVKYMLSKFQSIASIRGQVIEGFEYYTIKIEESLVGYLSIVKKEDSLFLSKLYITKSERGKGIGNKTLDFISSRAKAFKLDKISLTVNKYNSNTIKAYEKMGFKRIDSVIMDIGNGFVMDDFVMVKNINTK